MFDFILNVISVSDRVRSLGHLVSMGQANVFTFWMHGTERQVPHISTPTNFLSGISKQWERGKATKIFSAIRIQIKFLSCTLLVLFVFAYLTRNALSTFFPFYFSSISYIILKSDYLGVTQNVKIERLEFGNFSLHNTNISHWHHGFFAK